jgi:hypothetical protein
MSLLFTPSDSNNPLGALEFRTPCPTNHPEDAGERLEPYTCSTLPGTTQGNDGSRP